jgi:hypothetical protein
MYHYLPEDTAHAVLDREMTITTNRSLITIVREVFEKIAVFSLWPPVEALYF